MDADLSFFGITKFQRAVDSGGFFDLGIPTVRNDNNTTPGASTYVIDIPALVPGLHKIDIRACTINGCSERASITFTLVAFANPALNVRLVNKPIGQ